ncbi:MAG: zf-HC2 domain-containing protein [Actinobacteria bacterium]|nr:zf-HC2 domain-containing protein [Actinomycetota bacterium]
MLRDLELFLDRELPDVECRRVEEHLAACAPCMGRVEFRRRLQVIVARTCGEESVPPELMLRVRRLPVERPPD